MNGKAAASPPFGASVANPSTQGSGYFAHLSARRTRGSRDLDLADGCHSRACCHVEREQRECICFALRFDHGRPNDAGMELYADRYVEADAHAGRALTIARAAGQGDLFLILVQELGRVWFVRGKPAEAADLLDGGTEAARLLGNTHALVWNLFNRSFVALATGDVPLALATARESVDLSRGLAEGFHSAWAAVRLADVLPETGQPRRATELLLGAAGGEGLVLIPGSWRAYCLELLSRCRLALDLDAEARNSAAAAESWASTLQLPLAAAWAARASAAVKLHTGEEAAAAELALASTSAAADLGAPIEAARSRTLAGLALARGTRAGRTDGTPVEALTERELQLARLVVDRKTNAEIAAEL
jgi:tetratricopeptide (TPR) repeat protein